MKLFKGKFKYILDEPETYETEITGFHVEHPLFSLNKAGALRVLKPYAFDGPSGPTIDTKTFIWASLPHDVFYQMLRMELLPDWMRRGVDDELRRMCLAGRPATDKLKHLKPMWRARAFWVWRGVRRGGGSSANPDNRKVAWEF